MNNFCVQCGSRLFGPACGACGRPDATAARAADGSRRTMIVAAVVSVLVLAMIGTAFFLWHPFTALAAAPQQPTRTAAPTTVVSVQSPPSTVTMTRPAPPQPLSDNDSGYDYEDSVGDLDPTADVYSCELGSDGTHLSATVWVDNLNDQPLDVLGTLSFTSSDGTWLGQGGFSAAALGSGEGIDTYVDTGDANDPNAEEIEDAYLYTDDMTCSVDSLRSHTP